MNSERLSIFQVVGNAFNVIDIAEPVRIQIDSRSRLLLVWEQIMDSEFSHELFVIRDNKKIYGYVSFDNEAFEDDLESNYGMVKDFASPITPDLIVPSTMSLLDLIPLFERQNFFFILEGNDINHVVTFKDLDKLPMKLCIFSLFMKLEEELIEIISKSGSIKRYLSYLSKKRLEDAKKLSKLKYKNPKSYEVLMCTTFIDKKTIVKKDTSLFKILPFESKKELNSFFELIQQVRNSIAHSDSLLAILKTPEELNSFIQVIRSVINSIGAAHKS